MTRTTGNVALGGYFNDAFYLELLRTAHLSAVQAGVELTDGKSMGLGGRIRSHDGVRAPEESAQLDAKANEFLAQFGLTREATVSLLTNQLGVTQEELAYAWDIPTYTVMRGGKEQAPQAPEFFSGNPLSDDPYTGSAYRPNNTMMHRQGRDTSPTAEEVYEMGGDPRRAGVQTHESQTEWAEYNRTYGGPGSGLPYEYESPAESYPHGYGVNYENSKLIPNTPLEWALEATVGAMFGPTGRALMRAGGGRLFQMMAKNLDMLPPELLVKFRQLSEIFDPKLKDIRRSDALAETAARDQRVAEVAGDPPSLEALPGGGEGGERTLSGPRGEAAADWDGAEGERLMALTPPDDLESIKLLRNERDQEMSEAMMSGGTGPDLANLHEKYEQILRELYTPEYLAWFEGRMDGLGRERLASVYPIRPDESVTPVAATDWAGNPMAGTRPDEGIAGTTPGIDYPDPPWRRTPLTGMDRPGPGTPSVRRDLDHLSRDDLRWLPRRLWPESALSWREIPDDLSPFDLSEDALDWLDITHVGGVPRPTEAMRAAHPPGYYPPSVPPGQSGSARELRRNISELRDSPPARSDEHWYARERRMDPPDEEGLQVLPDEGLRPGEPGHGNWGPWKFPDGMAREDSVLDHWDPITEMDIWNHGDQSVSMRIGDAQFNLKKEGPGEIYITWDNVAEEVGPEGMARVGIARDALRELKRVVTYLADNGVILRATVESSRGSLVDMYRNAGFTVYTDGTGPLARGSIVSEAGDEVTGPTARMSRPGRVGAYSRAGYMEAFGIKIDPPARFREAALRGDMRSAQDLPFGGEEEWAGNFYALGKINQYSDDDIAHFYYLREMEEWDIGEMRSPFWQSVPGRNPEARGHNLHEMRNVERIVADSAYQKFRADRAATGYGHTAPDGSVAPVAGMEADWAAFESTVEKAVPEVKDAITSFAGEGGAFRPKHIITELGHLGEPGEIRISDILRLKSQDGNTRDIVVVELQNGTMQPFYKRSGGGNVSGDEAAIASGGGGGAHMWVPFDGLGQYGMGKNWFRKSRFTDGPGAEDPLFRYGTAELKDVGDQIDQYMMMNEGSLGGADDWTKGEIADYDGIEVHEYTGVTPNDMRARDEGFLAPDEANELLGVTNMDDYSRMLAEREQSKFLALPEHQAWANEFSPMTKRDPDDWSWPNQFGKGITGTAYGVGGLGALNATDFLSPLLSRETTFEESLTGTAPAAQPVESMLAWQAKNNDGWWSWIEDYPDHLEWAAKATAATMDALEKTSRSTNNQVLDGLGDGFREQAHGLATQMREGAVPLVGREDPELLKGVSRDLSQNGYNGHQIFSNDQRKEIENGDAMVVGYRSDEDYKRAVGAAGRYGVVVDGNYWRKPSDSSLKPREGEEWTREHLQKMATSGYFGGAK
jgi:hypothetical protein